MTRKTDSDVNGMLERLRGLTSMDFFAQREGNIYRLKLKDRPGFLDCGGMFEGRNAFYYALCLAVSVLERKQEIRIDAVGR